MTGADFGRLLRDTWTEWRADKAGRLAAALAYYTVFALAPLVLLSIAVAARAFGERAAQGQLVEHIRLLVGPEAAAALQTIIAGVFTARPGMTATLLGIGTFVFGASHLFAQLKDSLNAIWQVRRRSEGSVGDWLRTRALAVISVLGSGVVLGVVLGVEHAVSTLSTQSGLIPSGLIGGLLLNAGTLLVSFGVVSGLSAVIYKLLPDATITWHDVSIGAAMTAALLIGGQRVIGLYLRESQFATAYGTTGSAVVLLIWVYFSAQIVLFGAEFTWLYANRFGSHVAPAADALACPPAFRLPEETSHP